MTNRAGQPVNKAPYKVEIRDGKYVVLNNGSEIKGTHETADQAAAQLRELYANVPGAEAVAERKDWTGTQKRAIHVKDTENAEQAGNDPADKKLWAECLAAAKKKFTVYPSAYANGWAVQEYKRRGGKWREAASKDEGLGKWFAEKWVDISRTNADGSHPACGRPTDGMSQADYQRAYPKCVPASKAARMSDTDKKNATARKRDADNAGGDGKGQKPKMVNTQNARSEADDHYRYNVIPALVAARKGDPQATSKDKDPKGGLSAAGRKKFGVKKGVTNYSGAGDEDKKRWVRWALRFTKTPRPLKDDKGNPTRYALMFHAWGEPIPTSTGAVSAVHTKAVARAKSLGMGQYEKAETFYFEHDWEPVEGQPAEVASCALCGLNRWSDEHQMASVDSPYDHLDQDTLERLRRQYGPQEEAATPLGVAPAPTPEPDDDGGPQGPTTKGGEDAAIAKSAQVPAAKLPHPFMPAQFPDDNGDPRCRLCGQGTPSHDEFQPERPITAAAPYTLPSGITTTAPGAVGSVTWNTASTGVNAVAGIAIAAVPSVTEVRERVAPVITEMQQRPHADETVKAFVTEVNGKTLLTAPASAFYSDRELALASNEHFLWMNGRFVGAEKANRNGALWTTDDLELGQVSVKHGPLNWLHEGRHIIGTIADARLHTQNVAADTDLDEPYIEAASVIWKWIYPDEAWVVEQASDANKLWYSMECISKEVECAGQTGCGATASYGDYLSGKGGTCDHMRERSGTRRFAQPTFLGGAVIVPPVRPGWAEADARVMQQASQLAEKAFDQAGQPDVKAAEWEQLMAQVLRFSAT